MTATARLPTAKVRLFVPLAVCGQRSLAFEEVLGVDVDSIGSCVVVDVVVDAAAVAAAAVAAAAAAAWVSHVVVLISCLPRAAVSH